MSAEITLWGAFVDGVCVVAYPRKVQVEVYLSNYLPGPDGSRSLSIRELTALDLDAPFAGSGPTVRQVWEFMTQRPERRIESAQADPAVAGTGE